MIPNRICPAARNTRVVDSWGFCMPGQWPLQSYVDLLLFREFLVGRMPASLHILPAALWRISHQAAAMFLHVS